MPAHLKTKLMFIYLFISCFVDTLVGKSHRGDQFVFYSVTINFCSCIIYSNRYILYTFWKLSSVFYIWL